jgi:hypothetical protein
LKLKAKFESEAVHHILASSAETLGAFNMGFGTVNPHRPTMVAVCASAELIASSWSSRV